MTEQEEQQTRVINVRATIAKLKRLRHEVPRLPKGLLGQRRKLREVCELRGIEPVYHDDR